ncbi:MAG: aminodeoxychorismate/anthranilate synthase component II [Desulfobacteraceae bacterium]|nr:MAG: aminodeoxychorismate/anthranilate synthase component II [Desulfobacteraceae bacterium]
MLVIDNYDSFTHNLVQMLLGFDLEITVCRSDKITVSETLDMAPDGILISPGPKDPASAGVSVPLIKAMAGKLPILGVCLGMQCINEAFGGQTVRAPSPVHGKTSPVHHDHQSIFEGVPSPFTAARYHSLAVHIASEELRVTATTPDGVVMGIAHARWPVVGVQFHPESFMTDHGFTLIENFLKLMAA